MGGDAAQTKPASCRVTLRTSEAEKVILLLLVVLACGITHSPSNHDSATGVPPQDRSSEIAELLKQLAPGVIGVPASDTIERVRTQLLLIADESPTSRKNAIDALRVVLNNPKSEFQVAAVYRWRIAVGLLGELKAIEAIDDLVRNLNWTGESAPVRHPPVRAALVRIGEPAIPRLLSALSARDEFIRSEASEALGEIGDPAIVGLLEALSDGEPSARAGAAHALARIGGARARQAIESALRVETDQEVKKQLEYAVEYIDHVERLNVPKK
jgi:HEAT repeat protein